MLRAGNSTLDSKMLIAIGPINVQMTALLLIEDVFKNASTMIMSAKTT